MYTVARVELRLSEKEFWGMSMRKFHAMRKAQRNQKLDDMQLLSALIRGAELQTDELPVPSDYDPFEGVKF